MLAAGEIDNDGFMELVASSAPSVGYCNTMGTATTMNSLAEALGMQLPGSAAIPAPYRERGQISYETGKRIVEMVWEDLKPSDIMTREAFRKCHCSQLGHRRFHQCANPFKRYCPPSWALPLTMMTGRNLVMTVPLIVNLQPAGEYLGEDYHRAGGVPAVIRRNDQGWSFAAQKCFDR